MKKIVSVLILCFSSYLSSTAQVTASDYYEQGQQLKKERKTREAIAAFTKAIKLKNDYTEAKYELGWCYNDTKEYTIALMYLRQARSESLNTAKLFFELGYAFENSGSYDSAITAYTRCRELKPDYSNLYKRIGFCFYFKDEYENALVYFEKQQEETTTEISDYLFWYRKGFCNNALKYYEQAVADLTNAYRYKRDYVNTLLELGFATSRLKRNDDAIKWYKLAIELDPKSHIGYNGIGEVYRDNIKDCSISMNWYKRVLTDINPAERKANFGYAYCLNAQGYYSEAIPYLKKAIESEDTYTAAY
ncbi:MAG: tetratricopeptide repeat protein, partial [Chitinophagaceae bacterium]|nr:tetratricopeptide repeat protein [Chitinophagaceae bacterium]